MLHNFYLPVPSADGVFIGNKASEDFEDGVSLYKFERLKDDTDKANFWLAQEAVEWALENDGKRINPVCESAEPKSKNTRFVEIIEPGIAELRPGGNWKMVKKSKIKYAETNEQEQQKKLQEEENLKKQREAEAKAKEAEIKAKEAEARVKEAEAKAIEAEAKLKEAEAKEKEAKTRAIETEAIQAKAEIERLKKNAEEERVRANAEARARDEAITKAAEAIIKAKDAEINKLKQKTKQKSNNSGCGKKFGCAVIILMVLGIIGVLIENHDFNLIQASHDINWYTANPKAANFTISTADELAGLANIVNGTWGKKPKTDNFAGKTVMLAGDIDLAKYDDWMPIGDSANSFSGTFNGNGHIISNITINRPDADRQGLFGRIRGGKVQNLGLDNVNIKGRDNIGGIAGEINSNSNVINSYSAGVVSGRERVGGMIGSIYENSNVANSYSTGTVSGHEGIGGVAGGVYESSVTNTYSANTVSGHDIVGGVAGALRAGTVANCAALNPEVKASENSGRVVSNAWNGFTLSKNVAHIEMKNGVGNIKWVNKGAATRDGVDISAAAIKRDGTIGGRFTVANGWIIQNGSLPKISKPIAVSLQDRKAEMLEPINITDSSMYYIPVKDYNGFYKYISLKGESMTEAKYISASMFQDERALVQHKDRSWGYIDAQGKNIACCYTQGLSFKEGMAWVNKNGTVVAINTDGDEIKSLPDYIISIWPFYGNLALFAGNGMQSYIDRDNNIIGGGIFFADANRFQENAASVKCDNGKYGYINTSGDFIINCNFDVAKVFQNQMAVVKINDEWGIISKQGEILFKGNFEYLIPDENTFRYKKKNENWGWLNSSGKVIIQPKYEETANFGTGNIAPVKSDGLWGYIDRNENFVIAPQYKYAYGFFNGRALVQFTNDEWGTIDENGTVDLKTEYKTLSPNYWNLANSLVVGDPRIMTVTPSFDCNKASTSVEKMICSSVELAGYDKKMDELYNQLKDSHSREDIKTFQRDFIKRRNTCSTVECLTEVYSEQILTY